MFTHRFFPARMFAPRYFPPAATTVGGGFSGMDKRRIVRQIVVTGDPDEDEALLMIFLAMME